jgi:hypothetical protein
MKRDADAAEHGRRAHPPSTERPLAARARQRDLRGRERGHRRHDERHEHRAMLERPAKMQQADFAERPDEAGRDQPGERAPARQAGQARRVGRTRSRPPAAPSMPDSSSANGAPSGAP